MKRKNTNIKLIDTNIILRHLPNDHELMSAEAEEILKKDNVFILEHTGIEVITFDCKLQTRLETIK